METPISRSFYGSPFTTVAILSRFASSQLRQMN